MKITELRLTMSRMKHLMGTEWRGMLTVNQFRTIKTYVRVLVMSWTLVS